MIIKVLTVLVAFTIGTQGMGTLEGALGQTSDCGRDAFSKAVDKAAAALRQHSADTQPRILAGIRQLKVRNGWRDEEESDRARELLSDTETDALDQKAAQLLATMDRLSEEGGQKPGNCAKLSELNAAGDALQATVRAKTDVLLRRINAALAMRSTDPLPGQPVTGSIQAAVAQPLSEKPINGCACRHQPAVRRRTLRNSARREDRRSTARSLHPVARANRRSGRPAHGACGSARAQRPGRRNGR